MVGTGASATFTVEASGVGLTYQWFGPRGIIFSDVPGKISGATTSNLQILNTGQEDVGSYQVRISNVGGSVNSTVVTLSIGKT